MSSYRTFCLCFALVIFPGVHIAKSATPKHFKDWRVACNVTSDCNASTTSPALTNASGSYRLEIARKSGSDAYWTLSFIIQKDEPRVGEPFHISVDFEQPLRLESEVDFQPGKQALAYDITGIVKANTLMQLFARGNETFFNFLNSRGQETAARFSLKGLSASLLWIDDQQNRLKSPRTIGDIKTVSSVKNTQKPNDFTSGNTVVSAPDKIPEPLAKMHFSDGECTSIDRQPLSGFGFETAQVDANNIIYLIPCFVAAYNVVYRVYVGSPGMEIVRQLLFAEYSDELGWTGAKSLLNISYDAKTKSLHAFAKGRGLGDCGSASQYRWNAYGFKLVEYRYWGKCDGTRLLPDWPVIYPARK